MNFFKQVYAEMAKVSWPSRETTILYSVIVVAVSVFVAYYLGLFDYLFQEYGLRNLL